MDGLEAVELKFSEILIDNGKFRFDSEFFKKEYLIKERKIKLLNHDKLNNLIGTLTDYHANGSYERLKKNVEISEIKNDVLMIRTTDLERDDFYSDVRYISKNAYEFLEKTKVFGGEIIINKIGTNSGNVYFMPFLNRKISLGMNQFMIKNYKINNYYLYIYLVSGIGSKLIKRRINGSAPFSIDKESILILNIPIFSNNFQSGIENLVKLSYQKLEERKILYKQAEELLLKELDLLDFQPSNEHITTKSFKESFGISGRLDSEYYQPKYDELITYIKKTKFDKLDNIVNIKKSIEPGSEAYQDEGIPFIRVSNITKSGITDTEIHLSKDILKEEDLKKLYPTKDTILLSKDGTVGIAYKIKDETKIITSSALLHLMIKREDVLPEYLTLVLNSLIVQLQADRDAGGSIIKHWKPSEIQEVLIPIIDTSIQIKIEEKIKKSFELKEESKQLLDLAKRAVEVAIEKDEEEAIKILKEI